MLVLSGGLIAGMPEFVPAVEAAVRARCQPPAAGARVVRAKFAEEAPVIGVAAMARDEAFQRIAPTPRRRR